MIARYQRADYFEGDEVGYSSYQAQEKSLRITFRRLLRTLQNRGMTGGEVLEIGCGHGFFLDEAKDYFQRRVGTDLSETAASLASPRANQIWAGGAEAVPDGEQFDLVLALHVVEHVYDPHTFLQHLCRLTRPGGHLLLATPDAGSFWLRWMGNRWPSFKFPEHVVFFDERALTGLFQKAGLPELTRIPYPHAFPLEEVLRKGGISLVGPIRKWSVWIPGTTLALVARRAP